MLRRKMRTANGTKQKIHDAALGLFVAKGVAETSIRDLAQAAGIAEGTMYRHYASKDDLVWTLFSINYAAFAHRLTAVQAGCTDFPSKLTAIVAEFCRFFDTEPLLFRFLLLAQHQALPRIANDADNPVEVVQQFITQAIDDGEIAPRPPGLATTMVLGLLLQPAVGLVYGRIEAPFSAYVDTLAAACRRVLAK
jgi:AcrR family transcriptional regulator